jgi:type III pantothenate kinase
MLCAVDIGNSNIVIGMHENGWRCRWRVKTDPEKTADEYRVLITSLLREQGGGVNQPDRAILSSVVPDLTATMTEVLQQLTDREPLLLSPFLDTGVTIETEDPRQLGADLLANAAAAMKREMETDARVIATGGMAPVMASAVDCVDETEPWLTLEGLRIIAGKNR